jgi:choline kinase
MFSFHYNLAMKPLEVVILAAGKGSRLGFGLPKALLKLDSGDVLLDYQLDRLNEEFNDLQISVVVGYKSELFSTYSTRVKLLYNPLFDSTNTARSLALALESIKEESDVLWINGDLYFDGQALTFIKKKIGGSQSFVGIQYGNPDEEAMKFISDGKGCLSIISKDISDGEGEAVGINFVTSQDRPKLLSSLRLVEDNDYYEKALHELATSKSLSIELADLADSFVREIDFLSDLELVNEYIKNTDPISSRNE